MPLHILAWGCRTLVLLTVISEAFRPGCELEAVPIVGDLKESAPENHDHFAVFAGH